MAVSLAAIVVLHGSVPTPGAIEEYSFRRESIQRTLPHTGTSHRRTRTDSRRVVCPATIDGKNGAGWVGVRRRWRQQRWSKRPWERQPWKRQRQEAAN